MPKGPQFAADVPFNDAGACISQNAFDAGVTPRADFLATDMTHCSANDIRIANTIIASYKIGDGPDITYVPGATIECDAGTPITVSLKANLQQTDNSARTNIGIWIAVDGGNARTGQCNHYNLVAPPFGTTVEGVTNTDHDQCGDLASAAITGDVPLGTVTTICKGSPTSADSLHIGSCLGWTQNDNRTCPSTDPATPQGFRVGTAPGTSSKCNCDGFNVPITVHQTAKLEVIKACVPTSDPGNFTLQKDGVNKKVDATCAGGAASTTGADTLGAGTNSHPGQSHSFGEIAGTGTSLSDYTSSRVCVDRTGGAIRLADAAGTGGTLTLLPNNDVVCTITNTRKTGNLELKKSLSPAADPGRFNLLIKSGATTVASASNVGDGGTTNAGGTTLNTGTYNLSETGGTTPATSLSDYTTSDPVCVNRVGGASVTVTSGNVDLAANADVVCTITNTHNSGKLELKKSLSPAADPGRFNLLIKSGATTVASVNNVGDGGTTGAGGTALKTGTYNLSETAGTTPATSLSDYTTSDPVCVNRVGGASVTVTAGNVDLTKDADVVCTITNARNTGKLELKKSVSPAADAGRFNLLIKFGATTVASVNNVGDGGTTGAGGTTLITGTYNLSETGGTSPVTALADYTTSDPVCVNRGGGSVTVTAGNVALAKNADVVCTITNTRKPGKIELKKSLSPAADPGRFNLLIKSGATTAASVNNVGDGGTTGVGGTTLGAGTYNLSETAGTTPATSLSDYTTTGPVCNNRVGGAVSVTAGGDVDLASNADIVCTITNTRNTGKLELRKSLSPAADPGRFNLAIKAGSSAGSTVASATNVGDGGTTNATGTTLNTGTYNLSETEGTTPATSLSNYTTSDPVCVNRVGGASVTVTSGNVDVAKNADVVCTITNTRKTGKLELKKSLSPAADPGRFNLAIKAGSSAGSTVASATNIGDGGTTNAGGTTLNTGTYNLSEAAGSTPATSLADYTTTGPVCSNRVAGGSVSVTAGGDVVLAGDADVVCTITNTRKTGKLELKKALIPTTSPGRFNLLIKSGATTAASASNVGDGGTTGSSGTTLNTGTYNLSETGGTSPVTALTDYTKTGPACVNRVGGASVTVTAGNVDLAYNADVVCTITNTELSTIIIEKEVVGGSPQSFTFARTLSGGGADAGDNAAPTLTNTQSSSSGKKLPAGNYTVCETNLSAGWSDPTAAGYSFSGDGFGNFCTTFALGSGVTKTVHIINRVPPPGSGTRTIGYWKNWSSCAQSSGGQYTKAINNKTPEGTLDFYLTPGSAIYSIGNITALNCTQAVNLLNKNSIDGTKRAGDPIYGMVAQLLGAKINVAALSTTCAALDAALPKAQTLLLAINFDGTKGYTAKNALTAQQIADATSLGNTFDLYNQGKLGGGCPSHI